MSKIQLTNKKASDHSHHMKYENENTENEIKQISICKRTRTRIEKVNYSIQTHSMSHCADEEKNTIEIFICHKRVSQSSLPSELLVSQSDESFEQRLTGCGGISEELFDDSIVVEGDEGM